MSEAMIRFRTMYHTGFSPTNEQIKDIVKEYLQLQKLSIPFKNDCPSKDWIRGFMNRNKLLIKKATMVSSVRKSATGNPFIVYDFFDVIEDIINNIIFGISGIVMRVGFPMTLQNVWLLV